MRLFVGLPVAVDVRQRLATGVADLPAELPGLRWPPPSAWHLTLAFLGEVDDDRLGAVRDVVADAAAATGAIELRLGGAGRFGPRVLWAGITDEPAGRAASLGTRVQDALVQAGLPVQRRPVALHLTVARAGRRRVDDRCVQALDDALAASGAAGTGWCATTLTVWRSHLGDGPARYEVVGGATFDA